MNSVLNELDFSSGNSWLGLLVTQASLGNPAVQNSKAFKPIYTYDHPAVSRARKMYSKGQYKQSEIARAVGVHPKSISRWLTKGLLDERQAAA